MIRSSTYLLLIIMSCLTAYGADPGASIEQLIEAGVKSYQSGQFQEAQTAFQSALEQEPRNSLVLYNLGLAEFKLGKPGLALGLWRKALNIAPSMSEVREALSFGTANLPRQEPLGGGSLTVWIDDHLLTYIPQEVLWITLAGSLLVFGWLLLGYLGKRKRALEEETRLPGFPTGTSLTGLLLLSVVFSLALKIEEADKVKATLIAKRAEAKSGPSAEAATLFEISEGNEVLVRKSDGEWVQVSYSTGKIGWIPRENLFLTSGRESW